MSRKAQLKREQLEQELKTQAANRQRNFLLLLVGGMVAFIVYIGWISNSLETNNLKQHSTIFKTTATIAIDFFLDLDVLASLSEAVQSGDRDTYNDLIEGHSESIELVSFIYPQINVYTVTPRFEIIEGNTKSVISPDDYQTVFERAESFLEEHGSDEYVPSATYEVPNESLTSNWYNIGFVEIVDGNNEPVAIMVFEASDKIGSTIGNLYTITGIILFSVIGVLAGIFFWRRSRAKDSEEKSITEKLQVMMDEESQATVETTQ